MGSLDLCLHKPGASRDLGEARTDPALPLRRSGPAHTPPPGFGLSAACGGATLSRASEGEGWGPCVHADGRGPCSFSPVLPHPCQGPWR